MYVLIVNPTSGNGRGQRTGTRVERLLSRMGFPYQVQITQSPGHATDIARSMLQEKELQAVIAIGGDGTVHEVGNALAGTKIPMGYVPAGSGNDFALAHGIPTRPEAAVNRILKGEVRRIDTGRIGGRTFVGFAGMGFDGQVADRVNRSAFHRRLGRLAYPLGFLQTLWNYGPTRLQLTVDGKRHDMDGVWIVAVCNQPNYGGGMKMCPTASCHDGQLDLCCVHDLGHRQLIRLFPRVYKGRHIDHPSIQLHRGFRITLESDPPLLVHADGEVIGKTPLTISVFPQSLSIL